MSDSVSKLLSLHRYLFQWNVTVTIYILSVPEKQLRNSFQAFSRVKSIGGSVGQGMTSLLCRLRAVWHL